MKSSKTQIQTTTVSVDAVSRDRINQEADRLGLSQRQMIQRLLETYEIQLKLASDSDAFQVDEELVRKIYESLDKVYKRDDRVVAFIREQEKLFLSPILRSVQSTDAQLNKLIEILSNLD